MTRPFTTWIWFQPTLPSASGSDDCDRRARTIRPRFQPTLPSASGSDVGLGGVSTANGQFQPTLPSASGSDSARARYPLPSSSFQPTLPSASGSDRLGRRAGVAGLVVSTHAPLGLGERPARPSASSCPSSRFNPRSPRPRGATAQTDVERLTKEFQPTLPSASASALGRSRPPPLA